MSYNPQNPNGQATAANSSPVVLASDQMPLASTLGDTMANFTTSTLGSALLIFNGTTWERSRGVDSFSGSTANNTVPGPLAVGTGPGYAIRYDPANLGTAVNSASAINVDGASSMVFGISTTTTGTFTFEATADNTNWFAVEVFDSSADLWVSGQNLTPTVGKTYYIACAGLRQVRLRTVTTLGATVAHTATLTLGNQVVTAMDTGFAPHNFGYTLVHRDGEYTTTQTTTALWTPTTGKRFAVTDLTISVGGTTSGIITVFDSAAATAYSVGTTPAIFRGTFIPSNQVSPGIAKSFNVPYYSVAVNNRVHITTSAAMTVYIQLNGYEI